jgi:general L-amino acid transport system permease protein
MAVSRPPPVRTSGVVGWLRINLFSSPFNAIVTIVVGAILLWSGFGLLRWIFFEASWDRVWVNLKLFAVFRYPDEQLWRPMVSLALLLGLLGVNTGAAQRLGDSPIVTGIFRSLAAVVAGLALLALIFWGSVRILWPLVLVMMLVGYALGRARPGITRALPWMWALSFPLALFILYGVTPGEGFLHVISAREWGGFMLTLILTTGLIPSFPIGIALALGRRSDLPAIKYFCIGFIEVVRGAPLIMWLFIASLLRRPIWPRTSAAASRRSPRARARRRVPWACPAGRRPA